MRLLININIDNEKTWLEICESMKTIINHHLEALKKDLKEHSNSEMSSNWYCDDSSDCNKCVFNKNNANDFAEHLKDINAGEEEKQRFLSKLSNNEELGAEINNILNCCYVNFNISNISDFVHHNNCPYYKPCNKFIDNMTYQEVQALIKKLR